MTKGTSSSGDIDEAVAGNQTCEDDSCHLEDDSGEDWGTFHDPEFDPFEPYDDFRDSEEFIVQRIFDEYRYTVIELLATATRSMQPTAVADCLNSIASSGAMLRFVDLILTERGARGFRKYFALLGRAGRTFLSAPGSFGIANCIVLEEVWRALHAFIGSAELAHAMLAYFTGNESGHPSDARGEPDEWGPYMCNEAEVLELCGYALTSCDFTLMERALDVASQVFVGRCLPSAHNRIVLRAMSELAQNSFASAITQLEAGSEDLSKCGLALLADHLAVTVKTLEAESTGELKEKYAW
jgi:hypothetical protein